MQGKVLVPKMNIKANKHQKN